MKRILFFIFLLFCVIILLPSLLAVFLSRPTEKTPLSASPTVAVWRADTKEVVHFDLETYLCGVVAAEMPASFHEEALKAQAVAARTYIYNRMLSGERSPDHPEAAVCTDSAHCKAWHSDDVLRNGLGAGWYETYFPKIQSAVLDTHGEIITYNEEPIVAVFHSTGSGRTENSADVWGGDLPYLKSVESAGDAASPKFTSTVTKPRAEVASALGVLDTIVSDYVRSEGGAVLSVTIGGTPFRGTDIRAKFGLASANFEIEETADALIFHVKGNGHGVGLSQYGANYMAENGSSYADILTTYYTDVTLECAW